MSIRPFCLVVVFVLACLTNAHAQSTMPAPAPPIIGSKSYLVIDGQTGQELAALDPDTPLPPASLTKLMTTYVVFKALAQGQINLQDEVTISEKAWRMPGSRMFVEVGKRVSIDDLLHGVIIQSGNDASVALAEHIAGTEDVFAEMMNQYAGQLGMLSSHFANATGLPTEGHVTTARDLATLARAMITEFPEHYSWHSIKEFTFNDITQSNRNRLLWRDPSVDGLKTGHTEEAGYCLVASAERNGMRIISVVMGTASEKHEPTAVRRCSITVSAFSKRACCSRPARKSRRRESGSRRTRHRASGCSRISTLPCAAEPTISSSLPSTCRRSSRRRSVPASRWPNSRSSLATVKFSALRCARSTTTRSAPSGSARKTASA
jgi:D-alanyl-D-alanine carboxypeptidase